MDNGIEVDMSVGEQYEIDLIHTLKELAKLDRVISEKESEIKALKAEFQSMEKACSSKMLSDEIDKITIAGVEFSQALPAFKIIPENETQAFEWLVQQGFDGAIKRSKETINHQTLSKLLRERMENNGIETIPAELFQCVNTCKLKIKTK